MSVRYIYSNNGLSMASKAADYVLEDGEVEFDHEATEAELAAAFTSYETLKTNKSIKQQITEFESQITYRMLRESISGSTATNENWVKDDGTYRTAAEQVAYIDEQIEALRAQLK